MAKLDFKIEEYPILHELNKYPPITGKDKLNIEKTILNLNCEKLFEEVVTYVKSSQNNKKANLEKLNTLFQHYQSADYIPYSIKPAGRGCKWRTKCDRENLGHIWQCHRGLTLEERKEGLEPKTNLWTESIQEYLRPKIESLNRDLVRRRVQTLARQKTARTAKLNEKRGFSGGYFLTRSNRRKSKKRKSRKRKQRKRKSRKNNYKFISI
jgi:hypothetical protein